MYTVYGDRRSGNCYKLQLALEQLALPYRWVDVGVLDGATRTPEFLALNPNGKVPVLQLPDGRPLPESNAALHYLADGSPLLPNDRYEHAQVLQWMCFEQYSHEPNIATARFIVQYLGRPAAREADLQAKMAPGRRALGVMEGHLAHHDWFVAGRYTIADIALYAYTHVAAEGGFELDDYPHIRTWLARVSAQPGYVPLG
jgi:glutathione S-transferase